MSELSMVRRAERIAQFTTDRLPTIGTSVEVLCEDHVGTYLLPFTCRHTRDGWTSASDATPLEADVIGWRAVDPGPLMRPGRRT